MNAETQREQRSFATQVGRGNGRLAAGGPSGLVEWR